MNNIENYDNLYNIAVSTIAKYTTIQDQLNLKLSQKEDLKKKMDYTIHRQMVYEQAVEYMKEIIDLLSRSHIDHLEKLLNSAVETIFYDKNYRIEFEISEYRNSNCLDIYLIETMNDGEQIKTNIKDNGFGIKTIIGFILQVYFILYNKLSPVLFVDEGFSNLSQQYIPYLKSLFNNLRDKYGFIFVLVSHDPRLINIADKTYEVKNGEIKLILNKE